MEDGGPSLDGAAPPNAAWGAQGEVDVGVEGEVSERRETVQKQDVPCVEAHVLEVTRLQKRRHGGFVLGG